MDSSRWNDPHNRYMHAHDGDFVNRDKIVYGDEIGGDKVMGSKIIYQGPTYPRFNYRSEVAHLIDFYTQTFVGREQEWEYLAHFAGQESPGYVLVEAPPGYGKSALMAHLVHRHETGHWDRWPVPELLYFFIRQEGQRNTPMAFLQAINSQLLETLKQPGGVPADLCLLRGQFSQLWSQALEAANQDKPLLLLVDSLDEMASGEVTTAHLLPADLAPYVHVVVSSRPNPAPTRQVTLEHPLSKADVLRLHTFEEPDIGALLREYGTAEETAIHLALRVLAMTKGEPLFARFVCQEVADEGEAALVRLEREPPADVEAYFRQQFRQLDRLAEGDHTWEILGLLVVALGGMTVEEIAEALGLGKRQARKAIEPIMRFLLGETRLELMHLQLRKVLAEDFSANEQAAYRQKVLDWCQSCNVRGWPEQTPGYVLAHYARHLAEAGQIDDLYALVESQDWTSAKYVDTPWVDSLVQDLQLASAIAVGKDTEEWPRSMAYQLRRALIEDLMSRPSGEVVVFMAKLGRVDQALHYARRHPWQPFQLYHRIAEVVSGTQPDKALNILLQSVHLFDHSSTLNQYGARLVVAKIILESEKILAQVPSSAQKAQDLVSQAERLQPPISESERQSHQARYSCPILVLNGRLDEAKELAESLPLTEKSQALRHISLALPSDHSEKIPLAERALSILESAERNAETITREVQAIATFLPHVDGRRQAQFVQTLVSLEDELHSVSKVLPRPSWSWVVENIAYLDLEKTKDILSNSKWNSGWRDAWPALIKQIALLDPKEALDIADNQYSHHVGYSSVIADIVRIVAVRFGNTAEAEELISKYSKRLSGSFGRIPEARLALAEAYLAQGNRRKAEEVFDEQVFVISDQGIRRGRNDLLVAAMRRSSILDSCDIEAVLNRMKNVGEGRFYNAERLLGYLAARQDNIDFIETHRLGPEAQIEAVYELAGRDPELARTLWKKWGFCWPAKWREVRSDLDAYIRAREAKKDSAKLKELLRHFDASDGPHDMCNNMVALPNALYLLLEDDQINPNEARAIIERVYPILVSWECRLQKNDCECYARSERALVLLLVVMTQLDRERAESMIDSLPQQPIKVSALKSVLHYTAPDDSLIERVVKYSREVLTNPLDLAGSYYDLAANVLPSDERDWIARLIGLAEPLVDDKAWPPPSTKLKVNRASSLSE